MADSPCKNCQHYDPITRAGKPTKHGWCSIKSEYPAKELPGQEFPIGVRRVAPGEQAKPFIVIGNDIVKHCNLYRGKP